MSRRVYVVGGDKYYARWCRADVVDRMEDASIVLFTGGADVSPVLYNKKSHPTTSAIWERDVRERAEFDKAKELGIPMLGICRGAQFLCVMNKGELVQHSSHPYFHSIQLSDGRVLEANSTHHQQQYIKNMDQSKVELLAWAIRDDGGYPLTKYAYGESNADNLLGEKEVEIAFYKDTRALSIQPHPEMLSDGHPFVEYCRTLIDTRLEPK